MNRKGLLGCMPDNQGNSLSWSAAVPRTANYQTHVWGPAHACLADIRGAAADEPIGYSTLS